MTTTLFEDFVNAELPLRIGTVEVTLQQQASYPCTKALACLLRLRL